MPSRNVAHTIQGVYKCVAMLILQHRELSRLSSRWSTICTRQSSDVRCSVIYLHKKVLFCCRLQTPLGTIMRLPRRTATVWFSRHWKWSVQLFTFCVSCGICEFVLISLARQLCVKPPTTAISVLKLFSSLSRCTRTHTHTHLQAVATIFWIQSQTTVYWRSQKCRLIGVEKSIFCSRTDIRNWRY